MEIITTSSSSSPAMGQSLPSEDAFGLWNKANKLWPKGAVNPVGCLSGRSWVEMRRPSHDAPFPVRFVDWLCGNFRSGTIVGGNVAPSLIGMEKFRLLNAYGSYDALWVFTSFETMVDCSPLPQFSL